MSRDRRHDMALIAVTGAIVALIAAVAFLTLTSCGGDDQEAAVVHGLPTPSAQVAGEEAEQLCLEPLLRQPGPERHYMLAIAEEAIAAGGREPAPGSCGAERLAWLRSHR